MSNVLFVIPNRREESPTESFLRSLVASLCRDDSVFIKKRIN